MPTLSGRLRRYSEKCVSDRLDEDFAKAVLEAAEIIEEIEYSEPCDIPRLRVPKQESET